MPADPRTNVGCSALFLRDNGGVEEVLLMKRASDATHGEDTWCPPGGWIDYGQTPQEAAAREAWEEVGVKCEPHDAVFLGVSTNTYPEKDKHIICLNYIFYTYDAAGMTNCEPEKHDVVEWVSMERLRTLDLFPPFADLVREMDWLS